MPSVQKLLHNYSLIVITSVLAIYFLFSPQPAFAAEGDTCTFGETCNLQGGANGQRECNGTYQKNPDNPDELTCQWDGSDCTAQCQPIGGTPPTPSPSLGTNPAPGSSVTTPSPSPVASTLFTGDKEPVDKDNYKAPQNANYTVINLEHTVLCEIAGFSPVSKCVGTTTGTDGKQQVFLFERHPGSGATGVLAGVIGTMYNPPTSSVQYLAGVIKNFGFAESAYAQTTDVPGSGASVISPVLSLWQAVRNISYLAFILIFLGVGFMIMFRQKINPQTVVTAQAALPGLVIGLLLVTFSYFIAALIIDLAFIGIPLVTNIITQASPDNAFGNATDLNELARSSNIFQMFGTTASRFPSNIGEVTGGTWDTLFGRTEAWVGIGLIGSVIGAIVGTFIAPGPGTLIGGALGATLPATLTGVIGLIIPIIMLIALLIQMFRLLLALIGTYIQLLVATLTGPFVILASSLPGRGGGIGGWLKTLLGNALVFPAVFAAFLFAGLILATPEGSWKATPPLFGELSTILLRALIAYGIILATPGIPDAVRGAFGIKPQQGGIVGTALSGFTAGMGVGQAAAPGIGRAGAQATYDRLKLNVPTNPGSWQARLSERMRNNWFKNSKWFNP